MAHRDMTRCGASIFWSVLIIVVFRTLAVRKYRSATA
jgi:hypothetical protein